jgi:hypothetical protein
MAAAVQQLLRSALIRVMRQSSLEVTKQRAQAMTVQMVPSVQNFFAAAKAHEGDGASGAQKCGKNGKGQRKTRGKRKGKGGKGNGRNDSDGSGAEGGSKRNGTADEKEVHFPEEASAVLAIGNMHLLQASAVLAKGGDILYGEASAVLAALSTADQLLAKLTALCHAKEAEAQRMIKAKREARKAEQQHQEHAANLLEENEEAGGRLSNSMAMDVACPGHVPHTTGAASPPSDRAVPSAIGGKHTAAGVAGAGAGAAAAAGGGGAAAAAAGSDGFLEGAGGADGAGSDLFRGMLPTLQSLSNLSTADLAAAAAATAASKQEIEDMGEEMAQLRRQLLDERRAHAEEMAEQRTRHVDELEALRRRVEELEAGGGVLEM